MSIIKYNEGYKFGRLTLVRPVGPKNTPRARWLCKCECGNHTEVGISNLISGSVKSCRCLQKDYLRSQQPKNTIHQELGKIWSYYIRNAKIRKLTWNLTIKEFVSLIKSPCTYCGSLPNLRDWAGKSMVANGVDRISSDVGYEPNNVVPCCQICNRAKGALTQEEFEQWINTLMSFRS